METKMIEKILKMFFETSGVKSAYKPITSFKSLVESIRKDEDVDFLCELIVKFDLDIKDIVASAEETRLEYDRQFVKMGLIMPDEMEMSNND